MSKIFYSFLPNLKNEVGHNYTYTLTVNQALILNKWKHCVFLPKNCSLNNLSNDWKKELANSFGTMTTKKERLFLTFKNFVPFLKIFKKIKKNSAKEKILFFEHFGLLDLPLIFLALIFSGLKTNLWLFYRFSSEDLGKKVWLFNFFHIFLKRLLGKDRLKLFTDSEIISLKLEKFFKQPLKTMPIPHTSFQQSEKDQKLFWWPGGSIRKEKGLEEIKNLSFQLSQSAHNFKLFVTQNAQPFLTKSQKLVFVKPYLDKQEYNQLMMKSQVVLLPYLKENYHSRTSGIFVEAVVAGALPIVTQDTWMEYELKKFNLLELSVDWKREDLLDYLMQLTKNKSVNEKFKVMQTYYEKFHSVKGYAEALKTVLV